MNDASNTSSRTAADADRNFTGSNSADGRLDTVELLFRVADLRDAGVITVRDFEDKKTDLLARL